jgi:hypothetical protein
MKGRRESGGCLVCLFQTRPLVIYTAPRRRFRPLSSSNLPDLPLIAWIVSKTQVGRADGRVEVRP